MNESFWGCESGRSSLAPPPGPPPGTQQLGPPRHFPTDSEELRNKHGLGGAGGVGRAGPNGSGSVRRVVDLARPASPQIKDTDCNHMKGQAACFSAATVPRSPSYSASLTRIQCHHPHHTVYSAMLIGALPRTGIQCHSDVVYSGPQRHHNHATEPHSEPLCHNSGLLLTPRTARLTIAQFLGQGTAP